MQLLKNTTQHSTTSVFLSVCLLCLFVFPPTLNVKVLCLLSGSVVCALSNKQKCASNWFVLKQQSTDSVPQWAKSQMIIYALTACVHPLNSVNPTGQFMALTALLLYDRKINYEAYAFFFSFLRFVSKARLNKLRDIQHETWSANLISEIIKP